MNDNWTEEELAALPQTQQVFEAQKIDLNQHRLVQENYTVRDVCHPEISFNIPNGKTLIKTGGKYDLVDELRR